MDGVILSTDDYFKTPHGYHFNPSVLTEAHDWNKKRANDNLIKGILKENMFDYACYKMA